jgi:hypothetical protein
MMKREYITSIRTSAIYATFSKLVERVTRMEYLIASLSTSDIDDNVAI